MNRFSNGNRVPMLLAVGMALAVAACSPDSPGTLADGRLASPDAISLSPDATFAIDAPARTPDAAIDARATSSDAQPVDAHATPTDAATATTDARVTTTDAKPVDAHATPTDAATATTDARVTTTDAKPVDAHATPTDAATATTDASATPTDAEHGTIDAHAITADASIVPDADTNAPDAANLALVSVRDPALNSAMGNSDSYAPRISPDGRYVVFLSNAANLVFNDNNGTTDVFVHDVQTGAITLVSVALDGNAGDSDSGDNSNVTAMSADGRYVVFDSSADNLVANDSNGDWDVFVRDLQTGTTTLVSMALDGSQGDADSTAPSVSADGRFVAFQSNANNLVANDTNQFGDIFVRDLEAGTTALVSVASDGNQGDNDSGIASLVIGMSDDGRYVVFDSYADNLVDNDTNESSDVFVRDLQTGTTTLVSVASDNSLGDADSYAPSISSDGRYVVFSSMAENLVANDDNGVTDVFVRDLQEGTTSLVSVTLDGNSGDSDSNARSLSTDGRFVVFQSNADNLVAIDNNGSSDVFVRDLQMSTTTMVSLDSHEIQGDGLSGEDSPIGGISADGTFVAFESDADNLVANDTNRSWDVFIRDLNAGTTTLASDPSVSASGDNDSELVSIPSTSSGGQYVAFTSAADNLAANDNNDVTDVFVRDLQAGTTTLVSVASDGSQANNYSYGASLSSDGRYAAFYSSANNLVANDTNSNYDIFVRDMQLGTTTLVSVALGGGVGNAGSMGAAISSDGRYVAFYSNSNNLIASDSNVNNDNDVFVRDLQNATTTLVSATPAGSRGDQSSFDPTISIDGRFVVFDSRAGNLVANDTNSAPDVFIRDLQTGTTAMVSVAPDGSSGNNSSSDFSGATGITSDDRYVVFESLADNLVASDTNGSYDVFVRDLQSHTTIRASVASDGSQGDGHSFGPSVSADGRYVAFESSADNLVANDDINDHSDIFVHDLQTGATALASVALDGLGGDGDSSFPCISPDGRFVVFQSAANNFVAEDGFNEDVFIAPNPLFTTP